MKRHVVRFLICLLAGFGVFSMHQAAAQTILGRISGTVTDPSGATIAGAKVTVTNTDTQAARTLATDDKGFYVADNLPIGPYMVLIDHPGFKRQQQSGFFVAADGHVTADFRLQLGESTQTVDVVAASTDTLDTVDSSVADHRNTLADVEEYMKHKKKKK